MRRLLVLLCAVLLLLVGCAQSGSDQESEGVYELYYRVANLESAAGGDAIGVQKTDIRLDTEMEASPLAEDLMKALLSAPEKEGLRSPFPHRTELNYVRIAGGRAIVDLSAPYSNLSGVELSMADYCITLTLTQIPEIRSVMITVNNQILLYRPTQFFTARDVLISSTDDVVAVVEVQLYFCNADGILVGEKRTLELYEGDTRAESLVAALFAGPEDKNLLPSLPEGFAVQSVWVKDGICYVNLPSAMLGALPEGSDISVPLRALTSSLLSLENLQEVQFLVDGEAANHIAGVDMSQI